MKFTLHGFSQQRALEFRKEIEKKGRKKTLKLDCIDLMLLRWFVDFFPRMTKKYVDGKEYAWVNYATVLEDLPLLGLGKRSLYDRLMKMAEFGILEHKHIKDGGSYSYFGFGINYEVLIDTDCSIKNYQGGLKQNSEEVGSKIHTPMKQTSEGVGSKLPNKDSSIKYNNSINNYKKEIDKEKKYTAQNGQHEYDEYGNVLVSECTADKKVSQVRKKYGEYENVLLSDNEFEKLKKEFPNDFQDRIERLSEYIASTGKKYKNFLATIRVWARRDNSDLKNTIIENNKPKKIRDGSEFAKWS